MRSHSGILSRARPIDRSALDPVHPSATLDHLGCDVEPEPLLQRSDEEAADGVRLPFGRLDDLLDGGPLRPLEHRDHLRLLGVAALARSILRLRLALAACLLAEAERRIS